MTIVSVSYTHLDVYKRQLHDQTRWQRPGARDGLLHLPAARWHAARVVARERGICLLYTSDVYKRQLQGYLAALHLADSLGNEVAAARAHNNICLLYTSRCV